MGPARLGGRHRERGEIQLAWVLSSFLYSYISAIAAALVKPSICPFRAKKHCLGA
jgi:hypothetical protein